MSMDLLTHDQVAQFLKDNPEFFAHHGELLGQISVPHPYSGQAISIGERQVMMLRDRARGLENKLKEFIQFAEENDAIGEKLHKLSLGLMRARTLEAALQSLYLSLHEDFAVPHATVRLWLLPPANAGLTSASPKLASAETSFWGESSPALTEFERVSEDIRVLASGLNAPHCGHAAPDEVRAWFGEIGANQRSFALAPLKESNLNGLLVLASEDAKRFYPEMGTLYLQWLSELTGAALSRFV